MGLILDKTYIRLGDPRTTARPDRQETMRPGTVDVFIYTYESLEARKSGAAPLDTILFSVALVDTDLLDTTDENFLHLKRKTAEELSAYMYEKVKAHPVFKNAQDELEFSFKENEDGNRS